VRVPDAAAGQRFKCPKCGQVLVSASAPVHEARLPAAVASMPTSRLQSQRRERDEGFERPKTSGLAIASLILGIGSLLCPPVGLVGLGLGIGALISIGNSSGRRTGAGFAVAGLALAVVLGTASSLGGYFFYKRAVKPAVEKVREVAGRAQSSNDLKQIGVAMHRYVDERHHFPAAAVTHPTDGRPLLSWRVELLQYMGPEELALYHRFRLDEPWDSPLNKALLDEMPGVYGDDDGSHGTRYQVFVGRGTMFEPKSKIGFAAVIDGSSNTLLVVEAANKVPWTKPEDLLYDATRPLPAFHRRQGTGFALLMADGALRTFREDFDQVEMRKVITRNDGNFIDFQLLEK
jgi:hypothetical protein